MNTLTQAQCGAQLMPAFWFGAIVASVIIVGLYATYQMGKHDGENKR